MPARYPQLFRGITASWGGVLLFGPPGTGTASKKTNLSISITSKSIWLIFGRIDRSRRGLEAQRKSLVQIVRIRSH